MVLPDTCTVRKKNSTTKLSSELANGAPHPPELYLLVQTFLVVCWERIENTNGPLVCSTSFLTDQPSDGTFEDRPGHPKNTTDLRMNGAPRLLRAHELSMRFPQHANSLRRKLHLRPLGSFPLFLLWSQRHGTHPDKLGNAHSGDCHQAPDLPLIRGN